MSKLFFSYAGTDRPSAQQIVCGLQSAGVDIWWDRDGIGWGDHWQDKLQEAIKTCDAYILLLGRQGIRRWVKAEVEVALSRHYEAELPIFVLLLPGVDAQDIPLFLQSIQHRSLPENLDVHPAVFKELAEVLKNRGLDSVSEANELAPGFCPFPGLESFTEERADFFFGRQRETAELLVRFARPNAQFCRWLQIEGNSGVGKSSLVQSGLVPAIRTGWLDEGADRHPWQVLVMRPGADACQNLVIEFAKSDMVKGLLPLLEPLVQLPRFQKHLDVITRLERTEAADTDLASAIKLLLPKEANAKVLLVIDQLEELITLTTNPHSRTRFDRLIAGAIKDPDCPLYLVTTIRSDFMLHFAQLPALQALINSPIQERYFLKPIDAIGLQDAINTPVRGAKGWSWQPGTIRLVDQDLTLPDYIVREALQEADAALPLAANVMKMLWEAAAKRDRQLSFDDLKTLNGVGGALAASLDSKLQRLPKPYKERARAVLLELVKANTDASYTRRTITKTQALKAAGAEQDRQAAEFILNWLSGIRVASDAVAEEPVRLLVVSGGMENESITETNSRSNDAKRIDLIHEILLRRSPVSRQPYCKTLYDWIEDDRKRLKDRERRLDAANEWQECRENQPVEAWFKHLVWQKLKDFEQAGSGTPEEDAFLEASRQRVRLIQCLGAVVLVALINLSLAAYGINVHTQYTRLQNWFFHLPAAWVRAKFDSPKFPNMIALPAGTLPFRGKMIQLAAFSMAEAEITFAEYDVFVFSQRQQRDDRTSQANQPDVSAKCDELELPDDMGSGRGNRPVINVSWHCARAYIAWLNQYVGQAEKEYKLPSETQWEYAIRANADPQTDYYWGECNPKDFAWFNENSENMTHPVKGKRPNDFQLYDMAGNVWEWVDDCYEEDPIHVPTDEKPWNPAECTSGTRVFRGGSWLDNEDDLRSATRSRSTPDTRNIHIGFRLAQD